MKRYEALAETLAADIRNGSLPPGTRLPSIRKTVAQYGVSPSTAFQAYYRLEERGLVRRASAPATTWRDRRGASCPNRSAAVAPGVDAGRHLQAGVRRAGRRA